MAMNNSLAEVRPELVPEWSEKNLPLKPDEITFGSNKKVWWRGACGHEWQTSVKARSNGEKCPICSGARVIAGINDLATLEPLLEKQWSEKNKIKPTEVSIGSHKKVIWRCEKGHEWEAAVKSRTINKTGCPYCSHNKVLAGFNDLATLLPDIAAEWSDRNYPLLPTQVTVFANRKAWWKCKDCGREWNSLISTRSGGSKCPYCSGYIFLKGFNDLQTTHPEIASEWSEKNLSYYGESDGDCITNEEGIAKIEDLDVGVYLLYVSEQKNYEKVMPVLIAVPTWEEEEGMMLYNVKVFPKHTPITEERIQETKKQSSVKTGDSLDVWIWLTGMVVAIGITGVVLRIKNKKE